DPDEQMAPAEGTIDPTVELTDWEPLEGVDDGIDQIGFVDGVRRIDARLLLDDPVSGPTPGICGTFAVGATRWHRHERWSEITNGRVEGCTCVREWISREPWEGVLGRCWPAAVPTFSPPWSSTLPTAPRRRRRTIHR